MENKRNIWLDADPGIDDAVAFAMAFANRDRLNICGLSSVAGNQTSERVTGNALKLTVFLGAEDVPVVQGAVLPLLREIVPAGDIHGKSGLGYCELPSVEKKPAAENGILFLRDTILGLPEGEKMTLVPTGPLTNIALLLKTFPEVRERIDEIVLMGGSGAGGNVTATAEFNIWADPEAAQIVFGAGLPIVMCGLDVTQQCILTREQILGLYQSDKTVQHAYGEMLRFYLDSPSYKGSDGAAIHDAVTVLYLLHPRLFAGKRMHVEVDCSEGLNRGMTVCDMRRSQLQKPGDVLVLNQVDLPAFQKIVLDTLASYDAVSE
ncbi:MAG: nucleoside hydrolase [Lachnospiraceae bacterium]|nr:nucleoside hydrolase [Lachnospiraceae bacterium]